MEKLRKKHLLLLENTKLNFQRFLIKELPWNEQLIGIKGSRGVGKTTMLLQYIKATYGYDEKAIYITLDDLFFYNNTLVDFVELFVAKGGIHLFIDEVHKYKNWAIEIKNIYDTYPNLRVVFTSSSLLEILNSRSDLSRRALVYNLPGLSYREFLNFNYKLNLEKITLETILKNHTRISLDIKKEMKPLEHFEQYLKIGYFPFYKQEKELYYKRLQEIINMIVEVELPMLRNTDLSIINKIKQLLFIISQSVPFKPNITKLAQKINTTRKTLLEYINYLGDAKVLNHLYKDTHGIGLLQKPEKIFLENTNFLYAFKEEKPNIGNVRETFFLNQLSVSHTVTYPEKGDFLIDNKYTFEIGGRNKTNKQIKTIKHSFVAKDDTEIGFENSIPLWFFGFLY